MKPKNGSPCRQSLPVYHAIKDGIKYPLYTQNKLNYFLLIVQNTNLKTGNNSRILKKVL